MNDSLIIIISVLISALVGGYIGMTIAKLKSKGDKSTLEERQYQLQSTIQELKENINKLDLDREAIRNEKEFF